MTRFKEGQTVRVPKFNQGAPSNLYEKVGRITFVAPPMKEVVEGVEPQPVEQQYMVKFEGDGTPRPTWESWLEAV